MSRSSRLIGIVAGVIAVVGGQAIAADQPASGALEEVVVTAQRRSEALQEVPLSITALSAASLEEKAVTDFFDYAGQIPNLGFANTGDGSGTARTISIRGISGDGTTGFYIDETPVPDSIDPRVLDVQRIEVLRGPQGTLYGARSMGGTVRLITQQPSTSGAEGRIGLNGSKTEGAPTGNYGIEGAYNLPLSDKVAVRFVGFYQYDAGFLKRHFLTNPADINSLANANTLQITDPTNLGGLATTTVDNIGRVESYGASGSMLIKVSDSLSITPRIMYQKAAANGFAYSDVGTYPVPGPSPPPPVSMVPNSLTQYRFFDVPESSTDRWTLGSIGIKYDTSAGSFISSTSYFDRTVDETEDETDFLWQNLEAPFNGLPISATQNYAAVPIASNIRELKQIHRFVQELRFASTKTGPWQYVVGFFYSETSGRVPFAGFYPPAYAPGISQTGGFVPPPIGVVGIPVNPAPGMQDEIFGQDYQTNVKEPALYGELSYDFTDTVKGTVGLRGYHIKTQTGGYLEGIAFGGARLNDPNAESTDSGVNPKVGVDWKVAPDKLVYAQVAKGFRPGGLVPSIPGNPQSDPLGCYAQLVGLGYTSAEQTKSYQPDKLWNYEIGAKTEWADRRVVVNGAGFFIKWDQIQQLVALPCGFQFRANSGAAEVKGGELEIHARPVPELDLSLGVGYQHARITEASPLLPAQPVGSRVYQVPDWTGNASVAYTVPLGNDRRFIAGADWTYTGDSVSAAVSATEPRVRPSYDILDARLAYGFGAYEVALVGKNLTNQLANLGDNRSLAAETIARPRLVVNTPRTIGLDFRASF